MEREIYIIDRFSNAKSGHRAVNGQYMIEFNHHTRVNVAREPMPDFPRYAYNLTPIPELSTHIGSTARFLGISLRCFNNGYRFCYTFVTKQNMISPLLSACSIFSDVLGIVMEVSEIAVVHLPNQPAPTLTRDIIIRDLR
jgi:hypothetical protein